MIEKIQEKKTKADLPQLWDTVQGIINTSRGHPGPVMLPPDKALAPGERPPGRCSARRSRQKHEKTEI